jgi:cation:H+ antiporter
VARELGVSEAVIGLSLVAVGTSLPELATAAVAAWRGHSEVALGNVIGANTFNILAIMGLVTLVSPLPVPKRILAFDLWFMLAATVGFIAWMTLRHRLPRPLAVGFLAIYAGYLAWLYSTDPGRVMVGTLGG